MVSLAVVRPGSLTCLLELWHGQARCMQLWSKGLPMTELASWSTCIWINSFQNSPFSRDISTRSLGCRGGLIANCQKMRKQQGPSGRNETIASSGGGTARWTSVLITSCRSTALGCRWTRGGGCPPAARPAAADDPAPAWGSQTSPHSHTGRDRAGRGWRADSKPWGRCAARCLKRPEQSCWRKGCCPCFAWTWRSASGKGPWQTALWCKTLTWPLSPSGWTYSAVSLERAAEGREAAPGASRFRSPLASPKAAAIPPSLSMALGSKGGPAWCLPSNSRAGGLSPPNCWAEGWLCLIGCRKLSVSSSWAAECEGRCPASKWSPPPPWGPGHLGNTIWRWGWGKPAVDLCPKPVPQRRMLWQALFQLFQHGKDIVWTEDDS